MNHGELWKRFRRYVCGVPSVGLSLDVSRMGFDDDFVDRMSEPMTRALSAMDALEGGAAANVDEERMVGHYWLRDPARSPTPDIRKDIEKTIADVAEFVREVHVGAVTPPSGGSFYVALVIGVGGSALGPQLLADALGGADDLALVRFIDNTDPDGIDRTIAELDESLAQTLTIVISKSGSTKETRNGMVEVAAAYRRAGLDFAKHAVAVTCDGSELHRQAHEDGWLRVFPLWDWVGGRTSITSVVGLLPAALLGADVAAFLDGAKDCDAATRDKQITSNPAAMLAILWHYAGAGRGAKNMVVLPYADRLALFGRYLQQLVMESLGKQRDRSGQTAHQGLTVYGNKGSTDQHALVQQLRDGPNDFFATFITTQCKRASESISVEDATTTGDFLHAFWQGTRDALFENGRESITITLDRVDARSLGALVALFERAVGLYAELIDVNAYDQPGVEAGKKMAGRVLALQRKVLAFLEKDPDAARSVDQIAAAIEAPDAAETIYHLLEHLSAGPDHRVLRTGGASPDDTRYAARKASSS